MMGFGRLYLFTFSAISVTAQQDFFYIKPAADKICIIEQVKLSNVGIAADAGDAQEEEYDIEHIRIPATVTVGSGGAASGTGTLNSAMLNDTAAGFTARSNDTVKATTSGTLRILDSDGWNVRVPYIWLPPPENRIIESNAEAYVCRLNSTPTDAILISGTIYVRELP